MRYFLWILVSLSALVIQSPAPIQHHCPQISVYFSPHGGCADAIVREIDGACKSIYIQAYSFTSDKISVAIGNASERGVKVQAILDEGSNKNPVHSKGDEIAARGASVMLDGAHTIAHSKVMIIDERIIISGSYNFTQNAEQSNLENMLIIEDPDLAKKYIDNFDLHREHSRKLNSRPFKSNMLKKKAA